MKLSILVNALMLGLVASAAMASYDQPEGNGNVVTASYDQPEGNGNVVLARSALCKALRPGVTVVNERGELLANCR